MKYQVNGKSYNLDRDAKRVLRALRDADNNRLNTSQIKQRTGIEKNYILSHRYDIFTESGLATKSKETTTLRSGTPSEVSVLELTDEGRRFTHNNDLQTEDEEKLKHRIKELEMDKRVLENQTEQLREQVETLDGKINALVAILGVGEEDNQLTYLPTVLEVRQYVNGLENYLTDEVKVDVSEFEDVDVSFEADELGHHVRTLKYESDEAKFV